MEIVNEFDVPLPIGEAWATLIDLERIAPCMPGASLTGRDGDDYHGAVRLKVGPITSQYKGTARFVEKDETAHLVVIEAEGRDTRSAGTAKARVEAQLKDLGESTAVEICTDLAITGKVAQFGRGAIVDVSGRLVEQFAANLSTQLMAPASSATDDSRTADDTTDAEAIDLADLALPAERRAALGGMVLAVLLVMWLIRRRRAAR